MEDPFAVDDELVLELDELGAAPQEEPEMEEVEDEPVPDEQDAVVLTVASGIDVSRASK